MSTESARQVALIGAAVLVVVGVVAAVVIHKVVTRILALIVFVALAGFLYLQRDAIGDCAGQATRDGGGTCSFLGVEVDVPGVPDVPGG